MDAVRSKKAIPEICLLMNNESWRSSGVCDKVGEQSKGCMRSKEVVKSVVNLLGTDWASHKKCYSMISGLKYQGYLEAKSHKGFCANTMKPENKQIQVSGLPTDAWVSIPVPLERAQWKKLDAMLPCMGFWYPHGCDTHRWNPYGCESSWMW